MITLIADCETNGFLDVMTRLWTIQIGDAGTDEVTVYADQPGFKPLKEGAERLRNADRVVFHNGIKFDYHAINHFFPGAVRREAMLDTLVMARLKDPEEREQSLEAWGKRLGKAKGEYTGDFQAFTEELVTYARQDVVVGRAIYHKVKEVETWGESCQLEHDTAWAIREQEHNGFRFDRDAAEKLEAVFRGEYAEEALRAKTAFPPMWVRDGTEAKAVFIPKGDNKRMGYVKGCPLTKVRLQEFNPGSRHQVAQRLMMLGWKPQEFGKDGHPKVGEKILAELPYPQAKQLVGLFRLQKELGMLADGDSAWLKHLKPDGRIYGAVNPNGACTGRMSHFAPNVAQADSDPRMRSLWLPRDGWRLVGADASGIEARMLAHYLKPFDGGAYEAVILNGVDVHTGNMQACHELKLFISRGGAKTLLYAFMYGARDRKLGNTVLEDLRAHGKPAPKLSVIQIGKLARRALVAKLPGIDKLIEKLEETNKERGYLLGFDGRHVFVRSAHAILNTLLQGAGAIVMKKALQRFMDSAVVHENWPAMGLCANVHDEVQIECEPEFADVIGSTFVACIENAGRELGVRCPLTGEYKIGSNWSETH